MAREESRRRSFSRRVQYGLFAGYVVAVAGLFVGLGLIVLQRVEPAAFAAVRGFMVDVTSPITGAGRSLVRGFDGMGDDIAAYVRAGSKNRALRAELDTARRQLVEARRLGVENARLRRLAQLRVALPRTVVVASLIGSTATGQRRFATLDAGAGQGVRPGMPVRGPDGLVGLVHEVGRIASRVLLLTDGGSTVPVQVARSGQPALAAGRGDGALDVRVVLGGGTPFRVGDLLVTSGTGGVYRPGIPVALVTRVDRDTATALPLADPARLDFALVEPVFQPPLPPLPDRVPHQP